MNQVDVQHSMPFHGLVDLRVPNAARTPLSSPEQAEFWVGQILPALPLPEKVVAPSETKPIQILWYGFWTESRIRECDSIGQARCQFVANFFVRIQTQNPFPGRFINR